MRHRDHEPWAPESDRVLSHIFLIDAPGNCRCLVVSPIPSIQTQLAQFEI